MGGGLPLNLGSPSVWKSGNSGERTLQMFVTVRIGVGDDRSVRVPLPGDLPSLLQEVRSAFDVERDIDMPGQIQLRIHGGSLLTDENFGDLTDGDSLELLVIQGSRMPPLQLLSSPGNSDSFSHWWVTLYERIGHPNVGWNKTLGQCARKSAQKASCFTATL